MDKLTCQVLKDIDELDSKYTVLDKLGEGLSSTVCRVREIGGGEEYAMKVLTKREDQGPECLEGEEMRSLYRELVLSMKALPTHKHILEVKEILVCPHTVHVITELCQKAKDLNTFYPAADNISGRRNFLQLVEAVQVLHSHGVTHGQLKGRNVLFKDIFLTDLKLIISELCLYNPQLSSKINGDFDHTKWFKSEELLNTDLRMRDIKDLGIILCNIICGKDIDSPVVNFEALPTAPMDLPVDATERSAKPRIELFDAAAMDLLRKIGPPPFGPTEDAKLPKLEEIRAHPWLNWQQYGATPWRCPDDFNPTLLNDLLQLKSDLTALDHLLDDWMIMKLVPLNSTAKLYQNNIILNSFMRGSREGRLQTALDKATKTQSEIRPVYAQKTGESGNHPQGFEKKDPLLLYLELVIALRILPHNDHFANIREVHINKDLVVIVREAMKGYTMTNFFSHYSRNDICRRVFKQLAEVVRFMHQYGVVNMDLHPDNIVWKSKNPNSQWKIMNLGKARYLPELALFNRERFEPRRYFSGELLPVATEENVQVDVTALGRILHAMMAGVWVPDALLCGKHYPRRSLFHDAAGHLLSQIGPEPFGPPQTARRITMEEICLHPWFDP